MANWLTIAAGTQWETPVLDVRGDYKWSTPSMERVPGRPRAIILHHTVSHIRAGTIKGQMMLMQKEADADKWGLPYNLIVWPGTHRRVWYLNDVDRAWPHTYGWNDACAIAMWGDYQEDQPTHGLIARVGRLVAALQSMWGGGIPVLAHRDVFPTLCPGDNGFDALIGAGILEK